MATSRDPDIGFAQVLITCHLCPNKAELFCKNCDDNLCKTCVGQHMLSLPSQRHDVIKYSLKYLETPMSLCLTHVDHRCDLHCQQCDRPVCIECIASKKHLNHQMEKLTDIFKAKEDTIAQESNILENKIAPKYDRIIMQIKMNMIDLTKNNAKLKSELIKRGNEIHKAVDKVINERLTEIDVKENQDIAQLKKNLEKFQDLSDAVRECIKKNKELLQSRKNIVVNFQSQLDKFIEMPPQMKIFPATFVQATLDKEDICNVLGNLYPSTIAISQDKTMSRITANFSLPSSYNRELMDRPIITATICANCKDLHHVSCLRDNQAWISGHDDTITRIDSKGSVLETVRTKSGRSPDGLTVTRDGDLLYTDLLNKNISLLKNGKVETLITTDWFPSGICSSSAAGILVAFSNNCISFGDYTNTFKVVRYSGKSITQEIHSDRFSQSLFQRDNFVLQIAENRNGDICIIDYNDKAVVIISHQGRLISKYKGEGFYKAGVSFDPTDVATDSQCHIMVSDCKNNCVHILDKDGQCLYIMDSCDLEYPWKMDVDKEDRLWMAERESGKMKIIKYMA